MESIAPTPIKMNSEIEQNCDRMSELRAFDETKGGVKALVDAGITKVPRMFFSDQASFPDATMPKFSVPTINLGSIEEDPVLRRSAVAKVLDASANYGFFQVVNHGIPEAVMEEMLRGVRRFYDQDVDIKKQWYTRDLSKPVAYHSNYDLFTAASVNWRDSTIVCMGPNSPNPYDLPPVCRDIMVEYAEQVKKVSRVIFEVLSEGLNLEKKYLNEIGCSEGLHVLYHYYPACPEPHLTMGGSIHTDINFLTLLLQDNLGGLQCFCDGQWVDLPPMQGALVVNIGDLLQLITNDKLKSPLHRVVARQSGPRLSVASFFSAAMESSKLYGPIEELLSDDNPPKYKKTTSRDYSMHIIPKKEHFTSALLDFML